MQNPDVGAYRWILMDTSPTRRSDMMHLSLHSAMARRNGKTSVHTSSDAYATWAKSYSFGIIGGTYCAQAPCGGEQVRLAPYLSLAVVPPRSSVRRAFKPLRPTVGHNSYRDSMGKPF